MVVLIPGSRKPPSLDLEMRPLITCNNLEPISLLRNLKLSRVASRGMHCKAKRCGYLKSRIRCPLLRVRILLQSGKTQV